MIWGIAVVKTTFAKKVAQTNLVGSQRLANLVINPVKVIGSIWANSI